MYGHVIAPGRAEQETWVRRVMEQLGIYKEIVLSDDYPLYFMEPVSNPNADPFREGQIQVIVRWSIQDERPDPTSTGEPINEVFNRLIIIQ
jgi:hypothetical protein